MLIAAVEVATILWLNPATPRGSWIGTNCAHVGALVT